jgi:hypothetical protein
VADPLTQLGSVRAARAALDERELTLIDRARRAGATWAQVAGALGVATRQAAEQRRQRLAAAASRTARSNDAGYGPSIVQLRSAVDALQGASPPTRGGTRGSCGRRWSARRSG